ncbi:MAG: transcriptional regulator [Chthoniobacterales bacterium]|nr:transcriptional regulator [Chthoniobacterales bacterium]
MYDTTEITFVEHPGFTTDLAALTTDETYRLFQTELAERAGNWPVIRGTGGLRKARMRLPGRGKSGSARILYLWLQKRRTLFLYMIYTKGDIESVPTEQLKTIRNEIQRLKKAFGEES